MKKNMMAVVGLALGTVVTVSALRVVAEAPKEPAAAAVVIPGDPEEAAALENGTVKGRCLRLTHGGSSEPYEKRTPVPNVKVYFRAGESTTAVTSDKDGLYVTQLPEGIYEVGWMTPEEEKIVKEGGRSRPPEPFRDGGGQKGKKIKVIKGKIIELDPTVEFIKAR
jgi:hypothetical protein